MARNNKAGTAKTPKPGADAGGAGNTEKPASKNGSAESEGTGTQDQGAGESGQGQPEAGVKGSTSPKEGHLVGEDPRQSTAPESEEILSESSSEKKRSIRGYSVVPLQPGFRRAGREWPAGETMLAVGDVTDEQLAAIKAEPVLIVTAVFEEE